MTRYCKFCHKEYTVRGGIQKYCSEQCRIKANRKPTAVKKSNEHKPCNHKDCLHYNKYGPNYCDFFYLTGKLRSCKSGDSCTRYKKATESERKKYRNSKLKRYQNSENSL